ncbi:Nucleotide-binding universal stress protein, UspA family [Ectopseudomonas composti]|uniref:Nucleotide-binding universal stress protein, UspA family n=1 Tax=Ectopseudomonas composti TaxID=658457 RepID=A0A1I5N4A5_9GAMM|nr:universal stress protein [Pseudomonas composti]SFP16593.1 Nucleotide-binding universal stress protein, UspA family [Pseudomonas composti]
MIKILVATDLSERSAHAVQRAVQLIRRQGGGEWSLLHVIDDDAPAAHVQRQVQQAETLLQAQAERLGEQAGSVPRVIVGTGEAAAVIVEGAEGMGADLLVVGAHRKSALRDFFVGTTLERVVRSSHLPVLRVNGPVTHEYRHALLAMDLSRTSQQALKRLRELGLASLDDLHVASAVEPVVAGAMMEAGISAEVLENQRELQRQQLVERLDAVGANLSQERLLVQIGSPEGVIGEALRQSGADLLVLGTHAREGASRFFLGSVASRLLASLDSDALIVPPAD